MRSSGVGGLPPLFFLSSAMALVGLPPPHSTPDPRGGWGRTQSGTGEECAVRDAE